MSSQATLRPVHFVGSVPLPTTKHVFTTLLSQFPSTLKRLPDGETGERKLFTDWQINRFPAEVSFGSDGPAAATDETSADNDDFDLTIDHVQPTGYDKAALESYADFKRLRSEGVIPPGVRFQVSLPTPINSIVFSVQPKYVPLAEKLYEQRLLETLSAIQDNIPAEDLAIQFDMATEVGHMEYAYGNRERESMSYIPPPLYSPVREGIAEKLGRLASKVASGVELGFHFCYGDLGHVHFVQPVDTRLLVELINAVVDRVRPVHPVSWVHLPVPKDRTDDAYFAPLEGLRAKDAGASIFLGVVHPNDHDGTLQRIAAANRVLKNAPFGVATECGLGRTPPEELESIFGILKAVTNK